METENKKPGGEHRANNFAMDTKNSRYHTDFSALAQAAVSRIDAVLQHWLPNGKWEGAEYVARNPTRQDDRLDSFSINRDTGKWADFATGDKGGDLIALVAYLESSKQKAAADRLADFLGWQITSPAAALPARLGKPTLKLDYQPVTPIPKGAPPLPLAHPKLGKPSQSWVYRNELGAVLCYVYRFDKSDGSKEIRPLAYCRIDTGQEVSYSWQWQALPAPRPLYGLDKLAARTAAPVVVAEGEKAADAAAELLPDYVAITSPGGSKAANQADWSPLKERTVLLWPDHDQPGQDYAANVARRAQQAGAKVVRQLRLAMFGDDLPDGWDAADAVKAGWTVDRLAALLADAANQLPPLSSAPETGYQTTSSQPSLTAVSTETPTPETAPKAGVMAIYCRAGETPQMTDAAERVLFRHGEVYHRAGDLVRLTLRSAGTVRGITRPAGALVIVPVDSEYLIDNLTRKVNWYRWNAREKKWTLTDCPNRVATALLARRGDWILPELISVTTIPILRPDGSLLDKPGYDRKTGLLYLPNGEFPAIPRNPTKADAIDALKVLKEVLQEFPFAEPHHQSVALACILTALIRRILPTAPMFGFSAPKAGSGKSLLADLVSLITANQTATVISYSQDPEETRKRMIAVLLEGDAVINLDNIEAPLKGDTLCSVLTQESFTDRLLGTNRTVTLPTAVTWTATGNNLEVAGDLTRRFLPCVIDPGCERPEERQFSRNLYEWIPANRPRLVAAGLILLRAYVVAGYPTEGLTTYGSFEDWNRLVRGPLVWLGEPDPFRARQAVEDADPVRARLRALLFGWYATFGTIPATCKELVSHANETQQDEQGAIYHPAGLLHEVLSEHFTDKKDEVSSHSVGYFLRKNACRVEAGARFERAGVSHRTELWCVKVVEPARFQELLRKFSTPWKYPPHPPHPPRLGKGGDGGDGGDPFRTPRNLAAVGNDANYPQELKI